MSGIAFVIGMIILAAVLEDCTNKVIKKFGKKRS